MARLATGGRGSATSAVGDHTNSTSDVVDTTERTGCALGVACWCVLLTCSAIGYVVVTQAVYPPMDVCRPEYESPRTALGFAIAAASITAYLGGGVWLRRKLDLAVGFVAAGAAVMVLLAAYVILPTGSC